MEAGKDAPAKQVRHWVFTVNNPTAEDTAQLTLLGKSDKVTYLVWGEEVGEKGTPHLQGFITWKRTVRRAAMAKVLKREYWYQMIALDSTPALAATYCKKEGKFTEFGTCPDEAPSRKRKIDWKKETALAREGKFDDIDPGLYVRHYRTWHALHEEQRVKGWHHPFKKNYWFWGAPRTGKTSLAMTFCDGNVFDWHGEEWFDGYDGERAVLIDDVDQKTFKDPRRIKKIGDHIGAFRINRKYEKVVAIRPSYVIVTSNHSVEECFAALPAVDVQAIKERFEVHHFNKNGQVPKALQEDIQASREPTQDDSSESEEEDSEGGSEGSSSVYDL